MNAVFIGMTNETITFAKMLQSKKDSKNPDIINVSGVICKNVDLTTRIAMILNVKAYLTLEDAIRDADILFVSQADSRLASFSEGLKMRHIRNKILCHFSSKYDSSVISCGTTNSCYSINLPYRFEGERQSDGFETLITIEGGGKRDEEFRQILLNTLPNIRFCTKDERRLTAIATRIVKRHLKSALSLSRHLLKIAGTYDEESYRQMLKVFIQNSDFEESTSLDCDLSEIRKNMRLLSAINYSDTKEFVRNMEAHIVQNSSCSNEERAELLRALKYRA